MQLNFRKNLSLRDVQCKMQHGLFEGNRKKTEKNCARIVAIFGEHYE